MEIWLEAAAKAGVYGAALVAVGVEAVTWFLAPRIRAVVPSSEMQRLAIRLDAISVAAASVLLTGLGLRLWTHTLAAFGSQGLFSNMGLIALESRWGGGWRVQAGVASLLLFACLSTWMRGGRWRMFRAAGAVALCAVLPLSGHAGGQSLRIAVHGLHLLAAGLWLGSLWVLVLSRDGVARPTHRSLLAGFAPIAICGAGLIGLSGLLAAWFYLGSIANLWLTPYGRMLALKLSMVSVIAGLGALNWRELHRSRERSADERRVSIEAVLAVAVVLITAWLGEMAHPG